MCTASWLIRPDGYELFFNRDESRRRGEAGAPRPLSVDGQRAVAPRDADAGGTWIGVNEHGLGLGLLNAWHVESGAGSFRSRGLLVRDLLGARDREDLRARLAAEDLARYRGFTLLALWPGVAPTLLSWDGREAQETVAEAPLSSSSWDAEGARAARTTLLAESLAGEEPTAERLLTFHRSHAPTRGPLSPCMHRADARTVSASHLTVDARRVRLAYAPGPPCRTAFGAPLELSRAGAASAGR